MNVRLAVEEGIAPRLAELEAERLKLIGELTLVHKELCALKTMVDTAEAATWPT